MKNCPLKIESLKMAAHSEALIESLSSWKESSFPMLDLRSAEDFKNWKLKGKIANVHWKVLGTESFLLPPREVKFALLIPSHDRLNIEQTPKRICKEVTPSTFQSFGDRIEPPTKEEFLSAFAAPRNPWVLQYFHSVFITSTFFF
jgi:hypothetical protein